MVDAFTLQSLHGVYPSHLDHGVFVIAAAVLVLALWGAYEFWADGRHHRNHRCRELEQLDEKDWDR